MEKNVNTSITSTNAKSHKFSSELLNRPFSSSKIQNADDKNNASHILSDNMNISGLSFSNYNDSLLISIDNNNANQSISSKKRKPFEKLTFNGANNNFFNNNSVTASENKTNEETEIPNKSETADINKTHNHTNSITNQEELNMNANMNATFISEKEKSFIKTQYQSLCKETLEKAKLFNFQFNNSIPFWINFFSEIENDNLHSNSSYYKVEDKDKYVSNLVQMVKRDAELYDVMANHQKVKSEVKKNIKSLLITEIKGDEDNLSAIESKSNVSETPIQESLQEHSENISLKNEISAQSQQSFNPANSTISKLSREDQKINSKLAELLVIYNKLDEREKKIVDLKTNFEMYKNNLTDGGSFTHTKTTKDTQIKNLEDRMISFTESEGGLKNLSIKPDSPDDKEDKTTTYILIDKITLPENDFEQTDYELNTISRVNISRLMEIDRKLNKIDPDKYNTSINTHIKILQKEFDDGKERREKEFCEKIEKEKEKAKIVKDKKTIFDKPQQDEKKIKYKDYLKENKEKKEKASMMKKLDLDILNINEKPIDEEKRLKILQECEDYHKTQCSTEEYKERINKVRGLFSDEEEKLMEIEERHSQQKKLIADLEERFKKRDLVMEEKMTAMKEDLRKPYEDLMKDVDLEFEDNRKLLNRAEELEKYINDAEYKINELNSKVDKLKEEKKEYEKMWDDADAVYEPYDWGVFQPEAESLEERARKILESED